MEAKSIIVTPGEERVEIAFQVEEGRIPALVIEMNWRLAMVLTAKLLEACPEKVLANEARSHAVG